MKLMKSVLISGALALSLLGSVDLSNVNTQTASAKIVVKLSKPTIKNHVEYLHAKLNGSIDYFGRPLKNVRLKQAYSNDYENYKKGVIYTADVQSKRLVRSMTYGKGRGGHVVRTWSQLKNNMDTIR